MESSARGAILLVARDEVQPSSPPDEELRLKNSWDIYRVVCGPSRRRTGQRFYFHEPSGDVFWGLRIFLLKVRRRSFRCSFLIHLEPADSSHTTVEIFRIPSPTSGPANISDFRHTLSCPRACTTFRPVEPTHFRPPGDSGSDRGTAHPCRIGRPSQISEYTSLSVARQSRLSSDQSSAAAQTRLPLCLSNRR